MNLQPPLVPNNNQIQHHSAQFNNTKQPTPQPLQPQSTSTSFSIPQPPPNQVIPLIPNSAASQPIYYIPPSANGLNPIANVAPYGAYVIPYNPYATQQQPPNSQQPQQQQLPSTPQYPIAPEPFTTGLTKK